MKKILFKTMCFVLALAFFLMAPMMMLIPSALAEEAAAAENASFFSWESIGTMAGAVAAVLIIVQYIKAPLDKVWKIPTRVVVYVIAFMLLLTGDIVSGAISWERVGLVILNAFMVSTSAMGTYEMTFKKAETRETKPPDAV